MTDDSTLGGYLEIHERPPAFEGEDGAAYSVDLYVADEPDASGRFGAALLFVRWSEAGDRPTGHVETPYLSFGVTPSEAAAQLRALSLYDVKGQLDRAIRAGREAASW